MAGAGHSDRHSQSIHRIPVRAAGRNWRSILEFIGEQPDEGRIRSAAAQSSFDAMRALEVRERRAGAQRAVFVKSPLRVTAGRPRYFMNEGASGRSLAHTDPALDRELDRKLGTLLQRLGYADPANHRAGSAA